MSIELHFLSAVIPSVMTNIPEGLDNRLSPDYSGIGDYPIFKEKIILYFILIINGYDF